MVKSIFEQLGVHMSGMGITLSLALSYPPKKKSLMQVFISNLQVRTHCKLDFQFHTCNSFSAV